MASRRKRGPVAFRPRLLTGLALSVTSFVIRLPPYRGKLKPDLSDRRKRPLWVAIRDYKTDSNPTSKMSALEPKVAVKER